MTSFLLGLFLVNLSCYLPYAVFDDWSYLRFLLPTLPLLIVLMVAVLDALCRRALSTANVRLKPDTTTDDVRLTPDTTYRYVVSAFRRTNMINVGVVTAATVALAVLFLSEARDRSVFNLHRLEARYVKAGTFVAEQLPSNALVITSWESGSVRFYSGRRTLVWDSLDPAWLDRALVFIRSRGFTPYLLFERWEEPSFRRRFAGSDVGALDWPPIAEIASQVRVYRPEDRERYRAGAAVTTEYVR
jgi:hypothetical protein